MNEQLMGNSSVIKDYTRLMGEFQHRLGQLQESTQSMIHIGRNISSLQDILKAPKLRGNFGEQLLADLLSQMLPRETFELQYTFQNGERVDAVIRTAQGMVAIDAKFPLENFKRVVEAKDDASRIAAKKQFVRDVKKHIDDIKRKYILPDEGTYDFALMYIPAENVYYETIIKDDAAGGDRNLSQYALSKKVIPVSPNSFYAYLQAIVLGLKGMKIEERAKEIIQYLGRLEGDFSRFKEEFNLVGKHLGHAQSSFQSADKRLDQFGQKLLAAEAEKKGLPES